MIGSRNFIGLFAAVALCALTSPAWACLQDDTQSQSEGEVQADASPTFHLKSIPSPNQPDEQVLYFYSSVPLKSVGLVRSATSYMPAQEVPSQNQDLHAYRVDYRIKPEDGDVIAMRGSWGERGALVAARFKAVRLEEEYTYEIESNDEWPAAGQKDESGAIAVGPDYVVQDQVALGSAIAAPAQTVSSAGTATAYPNNAQQIAQARADYMARHRHKGHPQGGVISWTHAPGAGFEGVGWSSGSSSPPTCVGRGRVIADAIARGADGWYRVRLFTH